MDRMNRLSVDDKVADGIDRYPAALGVFLEHGFHGLSDPLLRKVSGRHVSIAKACAMQGLEVEPVMADLGVVVAGGPRASSQ